jgi:hypothetical protein
MERSERKIGTIAINEHELLLLDKAELVKKFMDVRSALDKAELEIETYRGLLIKSSEEYRHLRSKIPDISQAEYNKTWSWVNKIVFVLKKINRPLLSCEIIEFITPYEAVLQYSHHRAQSFSANLTKAVKYDRVRAYKLSGSRGYYYVLPAWLDINGQLIKEYEDKIFLK